MDPLRFWLPLPNGIEQEIITPAVYVDTIIIPAAGHEAGHIVAAHHYNARVLGIAIGFIPDEIIKECSFMPSTKTETIGLRRLAVW
jgi:hypothetical protein